MPINFSDQENAFIAGQRKKENQIPRYYSVASKQTFAISRDMEAYLILQKSTQKQKIQSWVQNLKKIQLKYVDRDSILQTYLSNRSTDSENKVKEMDAVMGGFSDFREALFSGGEDATRFSEITDVSIMATALQRPIDQLVVIRDISFHENVAVSLQRIKLGNQFNQFLNTGALDFIKGASQEVQNELDSWQNVVSSYPGRSA